MPSKRLNNAYDALVIVLDENKNDGDSFLKDELDRVFGGQNLVYYQDASPDADVLYHDIIDKIKSKEIYLFSSKRIVFCTCLDLKSLDERWVKNYRNIMNIFRERAGVNDSTQHYYVTFFRYHTEEPLQDSAEEKLELLQSMWEEADPLPMCHTEFLLYAGGFDSLDSQERGAARLLYLLSVRGWTDVYEINEYKEALHALCFDEYYESRVLECQKKLDGIQKWLYEERDPERVNFFMEIQSTVSNMIREYQSEIRDFKKWEGLYPVSIQEYSVHRRGPFGLFRTCYVKNQSRNAELEAQEQEYRKNAFSKNENSQKREEFLQKLSQLMNYTDLQSVLTMWRSGALWDRLKNIVNQCAEQLETEERTGFYSILQTWLETYLTEKAAVLDEQKREKEKQRLYFLYEQGLANKYEDLKDCFSRIQKNTSYQIPSAISPAKVQELALVNEKVAETWMEKGYQIQGVLDENIIKCNDICPSEIQYMRIGRYIPLRKPETKHTFLMVIH